MNQCFKGSITRCYNTRVKKKKKQHWQAETYVFRIFWVVSKKSFPTLLFGCSALVCFQTAPSFSSDSTPASSWSHFHLQAYFGFHISALSRVMDQSNEHQRRVSKRQVKKMQQSSTRWSPLGLGLGLGWVAHRLYIFLFTLQLLWWVCEMTAKNLLVVNLRQHYFFFLHVCTGACQLEITIMTSNGTICHSYLITDIHSVIFSLKVCVCVW